MDPHAWWPACAVTLINPTLLHLCQAQRLSLPSLLEAMPSSGQSIRLLPLPDCKAATHEKGGGEASLGSAGGRLQVIHESLRDVNLYRKGRTFDREAVALKVRKCAEALNALAQLIDLGRTSHADGAAQLNARHRAAREAHRHDFPALLRRHVIRLRYSKHGSPSGLRQRHPVPRCAQHGRLGYLPAPSQQLAKC